MSSAEWSSRLRTFSSPSAINAPYPGVWVMFPPVAKCTALISFPNRLKSSDVFGGVSASGRRSPFVLG